MFKYVVDLKRKAKLPLLDLPFEGYIQSTDPIDLPRLHIWMPDGKMLAIRCAKLQRTNNLVWPS
jgi:hypothetical protein